MRDLRKSARQRTGFFDEANRVFVSPKRDKDLRAKNRMLIVLYLMSLSSKPRIQPSYRPANPTFEVCTLSLELFLTEFISGPGKSGKARIHVPTKTTVNGNVIIAQCS